MVGRAATGCNIMINHYFPNQDPWCVVVAFRFPEKPTNKKPSFELSTYGT